VRAPRVAIKEAAVTALVALVGLGAVSVLASVRGERLLSLHLDGVVLLALAVLLVAAAMHTGVHLLVCARMCRDGLLVRCPSA
jgi:hypothetical protein